MAEMHDILLFSYGTLRQPEVQRAVFGREVAGEPDILIGFVIGEITIVDEGVVSTSGSSIHKILRRGGPGDVIAGTALAITADELIDADAYETDDYARIEVRLKSGRCAFVYVDAIEEAALPRLGSPR